MAGEDSDTDDSNKKVSVFCIKWLLSLIRKTLTSTYKLVSCEKKDLLLFLHGKRQEGRFLLVSHPPFLIHQKEKGMFVSQISNLCACTVSEV